MTALWDQYYRTTMETQLGTAPAFLLSANEALRAVIRLPASEDVPQSSAADDFPDVRNE